MLDAGKGLPPPSLQKEPWENKPVPFKPLACGTWCSSCRTLAEGRPVSPASALPEPRPPPTARCDATGGWACRRDVLGLHR